MRQGIILTAVLAIALAACSERAPVPTGPSDESPLLGRTSQDRSQVGVNMVLASAPTEAMLAELEQFGTVHKVLPEINAVLMRARQGDIPSVAALGFVVAANPDGERTGRPIDTVLLEDFTGGLGTWNQDATNVTDPGFGNRSVAYDGDGVYIGVLDSGLLDTWRQYFPEERIAVEYARSFTGGGVGGGNVAQQPNKWEHDVSAHGTHVTSTILGYSLSGTPINGTAPMATVIPVKVLNQNGSGWSSMIAEGILYVASLKAGPLSDYPVVINMSLSGPGLDAVEQAAIDYAIAQGIIIVASAGNRGTAGMGYPGAYSPVISVAASGWIGEWLIPSWWYDIDVANPPNPAHFYITSFSSRKLPGQELDLAAPGSWVVGPFQTQRGKISYYFLGGTSQASPHVAGTVALMLEKNPTLTASEAEAIVKESAVELPPSCRMIRGPDGSLQQFCWGADATGAGLVDAQAALAATP